MSLKKQKSLQFNIKTYFHFLTRCSKYS